MTYAMKDEGGRMINIEEVMIANLAGLMVLFIIMYARGTAKLENDRADRYFRIACGLAFAGTLAEIIGTFVNGRVGTFWLAMAWISNTIVYLVPSALASIWTVYVDYRVRKNDHPFFVYRYKFIPLYLIELAVLTNPLTGWVFTISADNTYARGPYAVLILSIFVLYIVYPALIVHEARKHNVIRYFFPIRSFLIPFLLMSAMQILFFGISSAWLGVDLALMSIQMQIQNEISYIDTLTGIFNRKYLDYAIDKIIKSMTPHYGIMIDMDNFKSINDTYGHGAGDQALKDFAAILMEATPSQAQVLRYAGDEFVVLLPLRVNIEEVLESIRQTTASFNNLGKRSYTLEYSAGYSLYDGRKSSEVFMKEMDVHMYENKREKQGK